MTEIIAYAIARTFRRFWLWIVGAGAIILGLRIFSARAEHRGAVETLRKVREKSDEHIIRRHEDRARVEAHTRSLDDDALARSLRADGLGPRPRD